MEIKELYILVQEFFGYKAHMKYLNSKTKEVACILYDSFLLKCGFEEQYGRFGAGIYLGEGEVVLTEFLGKKCSLNSDAQSIKDSLQTIDDYCRLRLPDKFLEAYYNAYVRSQYGEED